MATNNLAGIANNLMHIMDTAFVRSYTEKREGRKKRKEKK